MNSRSVNVNTNCAVCNVTYVTNAMCFVLLVVLFPEEVFDNFLQRSLKDFFCVRPMLSVCCLSVPSVLSVCDVGVLWPNGWIDQGETWHGGRPRSRPYCVRWGPSSPKEAQPPIFGPCLPKKLYGSRCHLVRR